MVHKLPATTKSIRPEDIKIQEYEQEVEKLLSEVSVLEESLESKTADLKSFQKVYFEKVGGLFLFNDRIKAALAREEARQAPGNAQKAAAAAAAEEQERQGRNEAQNTENTPGEITPELKAAFRKTIRAIHPDRAVDEQDRAYRTELTKKLNEAYRKGDQAGVEGILREFQLSKMPDDAGKRLILLIRQEFDLKQRIEKLKQDIADIDSGEVSELKRAYDAASEKGEDIFADMRKDILAEISKHAAQAAEIGLVPTGFQPLFRS